jgi:hypothetical protein
MRKTLLALTAALATTSAATVAMANPTTADSTKAPPMKTSAAKTVSGPIQVTEAQMDGVTAGGSVFVYQLDRVVTYSARVPFGGTPGMSGGVCFLTCG